MERRRGIVEEDTSSDGSSVKGDEEGEWMDEDERAEMDLFSGRKSRKRCRNGKEDAILGVFGSDEEQDLPRFSSKRMASRGVAFTKSVQAEPVDLSEIGQGRRKAETSRNAPQGTVKSFGGFGAKMLAKMGHVEGQGLGVKAQGIAAPIEATARAGRVGLGGIKERPVNVKDGDSDSEFSTKPVFRSKARKPKQKFMTTQEVLVEASGMHVPDSFRDIIDMTGKDGSDVVNPLDPETSTDPSQRLANMARKELQFYASQWKQVQERKEVVKAEAAALDAYIDAQSDKLLRSEGVMEVARELVEGSDSSQSIDNLYEKLLKLEIVYQEEVIDMRLKEVAVAALQIPFRRSFADWNPGENPTMHVLQLARLEGLVSNASEDDEMDDMTVRMATPYECLLQLTWVPKIRSWLNNEWNVYDADQAMTVLEVWKPVLPHYIYASILTQVLIPKLHTALMAWNPKPSQKRLQAPLPHKWLFPWLPFLGDSQRQIIDDFKVRLNQVLSSWKITWGVIDGLDLWIEIFGHEELEEMLIRRLFPKLVLVLRNKFEVDPANQDMSALDELLKWRNFFRMSVLGQLFESEFFPKWLSVLHMWLTSSPNLAEVTQWYDWWQNGALPAEISGISAVRHGFAKGLDMINTAMALGKDASSKLPPPAAGPTNLPAVEPSETPVVASILPPADDWATFRDVVENWCAEQGLLFIPLRKAHEATGNALHRITSHANGLGGVVCFLQGDVLWAQRVGDRATYEPLSLDEVLERTM